MININQKALATLGGLAVISVVQLFSKDGHFGSSDRTLKINLNAPYRPYHGEIEPPESRRRLAAYIDYNNGTIECFTNATLGPDFLPEIEFNNTIIVGYPGADKRTVLRQMEVMTTLSGRDAWDFEFLGMTRQPFIKTNYPHHEGIWGKLPKYLFDLTWF